MDWAGLVRNTRQVLAKTDQVLQVTNRAFEAADLILCGGSKPAVLSGFGSGVRVPENTLLHAGGRSMNLDEMAAMKQLAATALSLDPEHQFALNYSLVTDRHLASIEDHFGQEGLWKLQFLVMAHDHKEFSHFYSLIKDDLVLADVHRKQPLTELAWDNAALPQSAALASLNANVLLPSLSRKLYNPGTHHGYLVYGLGGPRILVSYPFQGLSSQVMTHDIYMNALDVATSLMMRGFRGTFLFLESLWGLNGEVEGVPTWLVWFSMVATHSDLVIFVKDPGNDLTDSQRMEAEFTPDRVHKKIVDIPRSELTWASSLEPEQDTPKIIYVGADGFIDEDQWSGIEAQHARPLIEVYVEPGFPRDQLVCVDEEGVPSFFPLAYDVYAAGPTRASGG